MEPHWEKTTWRKSKVELFWKARLSIVNFSDLDYHDLLVFQLNKKIVGMGNLLCIMHCGVLSHSDNWMLFRLSLLQAGNQWSNGKEYLKQHMRCLRDWKHISGPLGSSRCIVYNFHSPLTPPVSAFILIPFSNARLDRLLQTWGEAVQRKWLREYWVNHH